MYLLLVFFTTKKGAGPGAQPCAFKRFLAKDLMKENFGGEPGWVRLGEDKVCALLFVHVVLRRGDALVSLLNFRCRIKKNVTRNTKLHFFYTEFWIRKTYR